MKILVIGGTGNISYAIVTELLAKGHDITVLNRGSRFIEGTRQLVADRYNREEFIEVVSRENFDCVIDMICYNEKDAQALCDAFKGRTKQIVFCSTVDVYSKPAPHYPVTESTPINADPNFEYAWQKVKCENLLKEHANRGDFALTIVRPAATYNDTSTPISMVGDGRGVLYRIKERKPLIVIGDGSSLWTSTHRDDVGRAIANAVGNKRAMNKSYILASEEAITWEQYYRIVAEEMGLSDLEIIGIHWRELVEAGKGACDWCGYNFRFNNIFDCSQAKQDLDFKVTVSWREGVRRFLRWHDREGDIDVKYEDPLYDRIIKEVGRCKI